MTVNELIAELQVLAAEGHGELDVISSIAYESGHSTNIRVSHFAPTPTEDYNYAESYNKGTICVTQPCIQIWVDDP